MPAEALSNNSADGQLAARIRSLDPRVVEVRSVARSVADLLQIEVGRV